MTRVKNKTIYLTIFFCGIARFIILFPNIDLYKNELFNSTPVYYSPVASLSSQCNLLVRIKTINVIRTNLCTNTIHCRDILFYNVLKRPADYG